MESDKKNKDSDPWKQPPHCDPFLKADLHNTALWYNIYVTVKPHFSRAKIRKKQIGNQGGRIDEG